MKTTVVDNPNDRSFPFAREIFEEREIVYHGTWSTYSPRIERVGFSPADVPFGHRSLETILAANKAIARGSFLAGYLGERERKDTISRHIYFSSSFWFARAYSTDRGGEIIRKGIDDAIGFERICTVPKVRQAFARDSAAGLRLQPQQAAIRSAIELLKSQDTLRRLHAEVTAAREELQTLTDGGHPVVYAIRVDPEWFGHSWKGYLQGWMAGRGATELRCSQADIPPERLVGKVVYPNGTDRTFMPTWCTKWLDVENLSQA
jgi:hypothetical protein